MDGNVRIVLSTVTETKTLTQQILSHLGMWLSNILFGLELEQSEKLEWELWVRKTLKE